MNHVAGIASVSTSRRRFLQWLGLGLITAAVGACAAETTEHFIVEITPDNTFSPSPLIIPRGAVVTWLNHNTEAYTVTCDPAKVTDEANVRLPDNALAWDSGTLYPGEQWTNTFAMTGFFLYTSRLGNPESSSGIVVVTA